MADPAPASGPPEKAVRSEATAGGFEGDAGGSEAGPGRCAAGMDSPEAGARPPAGVGPERLSRVASSNAATALLARVSSIFVGIVLTPFLLHRLGRDLYGVIIAVSSVYEYLSLLRGGISGALRRFVTLHHHAGRLDEAQKFYSAGFWWGTLFRLLIVLAGFALAWPVTEYLRLSQAVRGDAAVGIMLVVLTCVISDQSATLSIPVYATGRTAPLSLLQMSGGWLRLGLIALALTYLVPGLRSYAAATLTAEIILLFGSVLVARRSHVVRSVFPAPRLGERALRSELFRYGGLALLSQAAGLLYLSTDNLLIGRIYGAGAVTHYSLGTRWSPLILGFLTASLAGLTPLFTSLEARGESERARAALTRVVALTTGMAVPFCLVPCVFGDLFLVHWVGPEYRSSFPYMAAMLAPAVLEGALAPVWMALLARGRIGWIAAGDIVVAVGNVAVSLVLALVLHLGLLGFALGNTIALLAKNLLLRPLVVRRDDSVPSMAALLRPLPRALAGAAPGLILLYLLRPVYGGSLLAIVGAGLAGGALCLAGSLWLAAGRTELRRLLRLLPGSAFGGS